MTNLRIDQLSEEAYRWYLSYLEAVDAQDIEKYSRFLADDCSMHTNNQQTAANKESIIAGLREYWKSYASLEHDLLNIYGTDRSFMLEALNHYVRHDGTKVSLRAVALTDRNESGLVTSVRVYTDTAPLFAG